MKAIALFLFLWGQFGWSAFIEDHTFAKQNVAIYIGTFDPFHRGHEAIVDQLKKDYQFVIVVPNESPIHKPHATDFESRLADVHALYKNDPHVLIPKDGNWAFPNGTSIVNHIHAMCKNCILTGVFGGDLLESIKRTIAARIGLGHLDKWIIFKRSGMTWFPKEILGRPIEYREFDVKVSSTKIRTQLKDARKQSEAQPYVALPNKILQRVVVSTSEMLKTGDIVFFSLRQGVTPYLVQHFTSGRFDHVGVVVVTDGTPYLYEYILGTGVIKSKLNERLTAYADKFGDPHFAISRPRTEISENQRTSIEKYLSSINVDGANSCTDLVLKAYQEARVDLKPTPLDNSDMLKKLGESGIDLSRYRSMNIDSTMSPVQLYQSSYPIVSTELDSKWMHNEQRKSWTAVGDTSKIDRVLEKSRVIINQCVSFYN